MMFPELSRQWSGLWLPPVEQTLAEWAEKNLYLSPEYSKRSGSTVNLYAWQRGIFDAFTDKSVDSIVIMYGAQLVKTLLIQGALAYVIAEAPGPVLIHPRIEVAFRCPERGVLADETGEPLAAEDIERALTVLCSEKIEWLQAEIISGDSGTDHSADSCFRPQIREITDAAQPLSLENGPESAAICRDLPKRATDLPQSPGNEPICADLPQSPVFGPKTGRSRDALYTEPNQTKASFPDRPQMGDQPDGESLARLLSTTRTTMELISGKPVAEADPLPAALVHEAAKLGAHPVVLQRWMADFAAEKNQKGRPIRSPVFFQRVFSAEFPAWLSRSRFAANEASVRMINQIVCSQCDTPKTYFRDCAVPCACGGKGRLHAAER